ncbi:MAG: acetamidase/formamidase family protein, partial [Candidatus Bathyarchaeota archaeon]|nr:acetamidase/formamidase family protein [Candidatus Bathyarchaeota archaeon]
MYVNTYTNGVIGPHAPMTGPVADGDRITFLTAPGCWGPMITPTLRGGHEVCTPVRIENAEIGDAVAISIEQIRVVSQATASGVDQPLDAAFVGDPFVNKRCPTCREPWPQIHVQGIGETAIRCVHCGGTATPFHMVEGYTMVFDETRRFGVTVNRNVATRIAKQRRQYAVIPDASQQVSILLFGPADLVGVTSRLRPFMGQLGTVPAVDIPDSHNAGDLGAFLIDAAHPYRITQEQYARDLTDGHLDIDAVQAGAILLAPVKVSGAGIYAGDAHAMQGDGEVAGHTTDVTGEVTVQVKVLKDLQLEGPLLLPQASQLPPLARPWDTSEWSHITTLATQYNIEPEPVAPVQIIGSAPTINEA